MVDVRALRRQLLAWYRRHRRDFPWRRRPNFYRTLVAEFMLQQTRSEQALPYYRRFLRRFPSLTRLARAPLEDVLKEWEGLGYYHRASRLHQAARRFAGRRPLFEDLQGVPGLGPYSLASLGSIVFGRALPVVDGNVRRVVSRVLALELPPESSRGDRIIRTHLDRWISRRSPGAFNQALMELGATVCRPRAPLCPTCPLRTACRAAPTGRPETFPRRVPARPTPHRQIAAAVIRGRNGRILLAQRPASGLLPNLWEFPGGKRERGESLAQCCVREIREELGIDIDVGRRVACVRHAYSHFSVTIHFFTCRHVSGRPRALGCQDFRWSLPQELERYPFPRANWSVVSQLSGRPYPGRRGPAGRS